MKKNVLLFGLIIGVMLCINMFVMVNTMYSGADYKPNDLVGYATMVLMFSLIFFGVRNYRNKDLAGVISFGKAIKTGALIAFVAASIYVIIWLIYYYLFVPDFIDVYTEFVLRNCSADDLAGKTKEMADFKEMYQNPLFVILITYAEVLPVGLIVALISALILKNKSKVSPLV